MYIVGKESQWFTSSRRLSSAWPSPPRIETAEEGEKINEVGRLLHAVHVFSVRISSSSPYYVALISRARPAMHYPILQRLYSILNIFTNKFCTYCWGTANGALLVHFEAGEFPPPFAPPITTFMHAPHPPRRKLRFSPPPPPSPFPAAQAIRPSTGGRGKR